jgi:hypothetical protein
MQILINIGVFNNCRMPDKHDIWALKVALLPTMTRWDVVVTTGGPYSTHTIGYFLKKKGLAQRWIVDWRDLWTNNHFFHGLPIFRPVEKNIGTSFSPDV